MNSQKDFWLCQCKSQLVSSNESFAEMWNIRFYRLILTAAELLLLQNYDCNEEKKHLLQERFLFSKSLGMVTLILVTSTVLFCVLLLPVIKNPVKETFTTANS